MKHLVCERRFRGKPITAELTVTNGGVQVGLFGGDKPHIGAVGIVDPAGKTTVSQFEEHREGILCQQWCEALAKAGCTPRWYRLVSTMTMPVKRKSCRSSSFVMNC